MTGKSMTGTMTAAGDGLGSHLDVLWSADQGARLLALAEQANRCDGWWTADDLGCLSPDRPREDYSEKWRTAIARLGEQCTNFHIFLANSPEYPRLLLETAHAPAVLFVRGSLDSNGAGSVAMVGSRDASEQAADAAHEVAATLADAGTTIVSGLARGIDTAAHCGALDAGGRTTAVVGTGIDVVFPPENRHLIEPIVRSGAVVSQFPPGLRPSKTSFPVRNAVIAGLSSASVVIEAEELSGTRIEMDYSLEFNRPVLLWAPVLGRRPWARSLAATDDNVHLVCSTSEIRELAFQD